MHPDAQNLINSMPVPAPADEQPNVARQIAADLLDTLRWEGASDETVRKAEALLAHLS